MLWVHVGVDGSIDCQVNVGNKVRQGNGFELFIVTETNNVENFEINRVGYIKPGEQEIVSLNVPVRREENIEFELNRPSQANSFFKGGATYNGYMASIPSDATTFYGNGGHIQLVIYAVSVDGRSENTQNVTVFVEPTYGNKYVGISDTDYGVLLRIIDDFKNDKLDSKNPIIYDSKGNVSARFTDSGLSIVGSSLTLDNGTWGFTKVIKRTNDITTNNIGMLLYNFMYDHGGYVDLGSAIFLTSERNVYALSDESIEYVKLSDGEIEVSATVADYLTKNRVDLSTIDNIFVPYTGATKDIDIGTHSFKMSSVFTVGSESSVYTQTTPGSISLKNPIDTLGIGISSLTVNGTTIYWPTVSGDPNGKYFALRSDIPPIDDYLSATSTNAVQNKVINSTISELSYQLAMVRENLFQTVLSEIDYSEDFATLYPIPDTLSDSDGTHRVLFSETQLREVAGNSIVLKQLLPANGNSETINGITFTHNGDGTISVVGTATAITNHYFNGPTGGLLANHKYLLKGCPAGGGANSYTLYCSGNLYDRGNGFIATITSNQTPSCRIEIYNGITINATFRPQLFDIADSITTVEEFNRIFPNDYYPYNAGEIRNTTASGIKVKYYNLLNINSTKGTLNGSDYTQGNKQNFEEGKYYDSLSINDYVLLNTIENIKVEGTQITFTPNSFAYGLCFPVRTIPNKSYNLEITPVLNPHPNYKVVMWYDDSGSYIRSDAIIDSESIIAPVNGYWGVILLRSSGDNVTCSYKDICFHLTTLRTGYAPYKEPKAISFASTELLGAGEAHDTIEVVEGDKVAGIQRYNLVHVKRVGTVDLGTLNWTYYGDTEKFFLSEGIANLIKPIEHNEVVANLVCSKYRTNYFNSILEEGTDKIISQTANNQSVEVKDTSYTDATAFKTAMSGVILNYELATPTRTVIAENLTFEEVSATIEQGGSIETIYETLAPNCTTGFVVKKATEVSK